MGQSMSRLSDSRPWERTWERIRVNRCMLLLLGSGRTPPGVLHSELTGRFLDMGWLNDNEKVLFATMS